MGGDVTSSTPASAKLQAPPRAATTAPRAGPPARDSCLRKRVCRTEERAFRADKELTRLSKSASRYPLWKFAVVLLVSRVKSSQ